MVYSAEVAPEEVLASEFAWTASAEGAAAQVLHSQAVEEVAAACHRAYQHRTHSGRP